MSAAASWRDQIPTSEWDVYDAAGFGRLAGLGKRPALLIIDVQYRTVGDTPAATAVESIARQYATKLR